MPNDCFGLPYLVCFGKKAGSGPKSNGEWVQNLESDYESIRISNTTYSFNVFI